MLYREPIVCADGYSVSIQANEYTYCMPRVTGAKHYTAVELGFPSEPDELINEYAEEDGHLDEYTGTVYPYTPACIVQQLIDKHGGIVSGECPPLLIHELQVGGEEE